MTLVELVTAMVLAAILLLVMTCQFIAHQRITAGINDRNAAAQEAVVAMRHMSKTLKFALFNPDVSGADVRYPAPFQSSISFTVEGGDPITDPQHYHLPEFVSSTRIEYAKNAQNEFVYINPAPNATPIVIATGVTRFSCPYGKSPGGTNNDFAIILRTQKGNERVVTVTKIHALPE